MHPLDLDDLHKRARETIAPPDNSPESMDSNSFDDLSEDEEIWVPSEEDHRPLHGAPQTGIGAVPSFLPLRLDNVAPGQEGVARAIMSAQGRSPEMIESAIANADHNKTEIRDSGVRMISASDMPDFDPEVDDESDTFVSGLDFNKQEPTVMVPNKPIPQAEKARMPEHTTKQKAQPKPQAPEPQVNAQEHRAQVHPVMERLRARFGLRDIGTKSETIDGIKFTFRKYSQEAYQKFVLNRVILNSESNIETEAEGAQKSDFACVCIAIVAIDDVPVYEVLNVYVDPTEAVLLERNPLQPPTGVVLRTAIELYPWLQAMMIPEFANTLVSVYASLFPDVEVETGNEEHWIYTCSKPNCDHRLTKPPRRDVTGKDHGYFCCMDGAPMVPACRVSEARNLPLD